MIEHTYDEWNPEEGQGYLEIDFPIDFPSPAIDEHTLIKSVRGTF